MEDTKTKKSNNNSENDYIADDSEKFHYTKVELEFNILIRKLEILGMLVLDFIFIFVAIYSIFKENNYSISFIGSIFCIFSYFQIKEYLKDIKDQKLFLKEISS